VALIDDVTVAEARMISTKADHALSRLSTIAQALDDGLRCLKVQLPEDLPLAFNAESMVLLTNGFGRSIAAEPLIVCHGTDEVLRRLSPAAKDPQFLRVVAHMYTRCEVRWLTFVDADHASEDIIPCFPKSQAMLATLRSTMPEGRKDAKLKLPELLSILKTGT
jgi:hypothetical protein